MFLSFLNPQIEALVFALNKCCLEFQNGLLFDLVNYLSLVMQNKVFNLSCPWTSVHQGAFSRFGRAISTVLPECLLFDLVSNIILLTMRCSLKYTTQFSRQIPSSRRRD